MIWKDVHKTRRPGGITKSRIYIYISLTHLKYPTVCMVYNIIRIGKRGRKRNNSCKMEEYSNRTGSLSRTNGAHGPPGLTEGNIWSRRAGSSRHSLGFNSAQCGRYPTTSSRRRKTK
jgi:hypothetical protein